jgi:hypothetical protein
MKIRNNTDIVFKIFYKNLKFLLNQYFHPSSPYFLSIFEDFPRFHYNENSNEFLSLENSFIIPRIIINGPKTCKGVNIQV